MVSIVLFECDRVCVSLLNDDSDQQDHFGPHNLTVNNGRGLDRFASGRCQRGQKVGPILGAEPNRKQELDTARALVAWARKSSRIVEP